jgi:hypothetical protein
MPCQLTNRSPERIRQWESNVFIVKTTWGNLNLKGPFAYDSAAEGYRETTGADFSNLTTDEQNSIIRERCKAR